MQLFFQEPARNVQMFSEVSGYQSYITQTNQHEYLLTDSKTKKQNRYRYKDGVLEQADIRYSIFEITVQRAE